MKVLEVIKKPKYLALAIALALLMLILYVYTQLLGIIQNLDIWLSIIPWYNALLLIAFAALFGITFSFQIYTWKQPKTCAVNKKVKGAGTSSIGTIALFLVAQCPGCASLGLLLLPASAAIFVIQYSWLLNLVAIALLLFTINYLGGFKKN